MIKKIILPGDPEFDLTLGTSLPLDWNQHSSEFAFVARAGSGILETVSMDELEDYLYGGEYDDRLQEIGEESDEF